MQCLAKKFISESENNKILYKKATNGGNKNAYRALILSFEDYLFKIYSTSYLHKSIVLNARELKRKYLRTYRREELTLNITDLDTKEERIIRLPDSEVNYIDEITRPRNIDFIELFSDKVLTSAMNNLTDRQKKILFLKYIDDLEEKEIARMLEISVQAVYKIKKVALDKIRKQLGGVKKNGIF